MPVDSAQSADASDFDKIQPVRYGFAGTTAEKDSVSGDVTGAKLIVAQYAGTKMTEVHAVSDKDVSEGTVSFSAQADAQYKLFLVDSQNTPLCDSAFVK